MAGSREVPASYNPTSKHTGLGYLALATRDTAVHTSCVNMWTRRRGAKVVVCSNMEVYKEWEGGGGTPLQVLVRDPHTITCLR